jgi:hypothetical protein
MGEESREKAKSKSAALIDWQGKARKMKQIVCKEFEVEDGKYDAIIAAIEEKETALGRRYQITANVESQDPDVDGSPVSTLVRRSLTRTSRLGRFWQAATGQELENGQKVDLDEMIGKRVLVYVENRGNGDHEFYPRIARVEPIV